MVGIFHCFAHDFPCQIQFSPRVIEGMGWTDGEPVERFWGDSRHVISANRTTGAYTRRQTLTNLSMAIGRSRVRNFPHACRKKLRKMLKTGRDAQNELTSYCNSNNISIETLQQEALSMKAFLLQSADSTIHIEDNICEHLIAIEDLRLFEKVHEQAVETAGRAWMELKLRIALRTEGRISQGLDITWQVLQEKVLLLLADAGQTMEDWIQGNVKTELYLNRSKEIALSNLRRMKLEIFRCLVVRKQEWNNLIGSGLHGSPIVCMYLITRDQRFRNH